MFDDADKFLKIAVGLGVLAAGAGAGYYYGIHLPKIDRQEVEHAKLVEQERKNTERQKIERTQHLEQVRQQENLVRETERKARYLGCYADVLTIHSREWGTVCKSLGRGKECSLEISTAEILNNRLSSEKKRCLEEAKSGV